MLCLQFMYTPHYHVDETYFGRNLHKKYMIKKKDCIYTFSFDSMLRSICGWLFFDCQIIVVLLFAELFLGISLGFFCAH